jgi:hypothetical protein
VAATDLDGDGQDDIITAAGPGGGPHVRGLSGVNRADLTGFYAYHAAFAGGVFIGGTPQGDGEMALRLAADAKGPVGPVEALTSEQLELIRAAAIARWEVVAEIGTSLRDVIHIADLPGNLLGIVRQGVVFIDRDAAGRGWFVDPTPNEDEEFEASSLISGVDLLTVLLHEFGHVLGLGHAADAEDELMLGELSAGVRRLPTVRLVDELFAEW